MATTKNFRDPFEAAKKRQKRIDAGGFDPLKKPQVAPNTTVKPQPQVASQQAGNTQANKRTADIAKANQALTSAGITGGTLRDRQKKLNELKASGADANTIAAAQAALGTLSNYDEVGTPEPTVLTSADKARSQFISNNEKVGAAQQDYFGEDTILKTPEDFAKNLQDLQLEQKTELEKQIEQANRRDEELFAESEAQATAAVDATTATFAPGAEGPVSFSAFQTINNFQEKVGAQITRGREDLTRAKDARAQKLKELEKAQQEGRESLTRALVDDLGKIENNIDQLQVRLQEGANEAMRQSASVINQAFKTFESIDTSMLTDVPVEQVAASFGIPMEYAAALKQLDFQKSQVTLDDPQYAEKLNSIGLQANQVKWSGLTPDQKNFITYQDLLKTNPEQAKIFAKASGFEESESAVAAAQDEAKKAKASADIRENTGVQYPANSKYDVKVNGSSLFIDVPRNKPLPRGECGEFVNDVLIGQPGLFTDLFAEKMAVTNTNTAVAGGAFVEFTGDAAGHVGIITNVFPDGSFSVTEANYDLDKQVSDAHIAVGSERWKNIVEKGGFYDPAAKAGEVGGGESSQLEAQIRGFVQSRSGIKDKDARLQAEKDIATEISSGRAETPAQAKMNLGIVSDEDKEVKKRITTDLKKPVDNFNEIERNAKNIAALAELEGGIGDTATITAFLKTIDPGSVARESEVAGVESARGVIEGIITNYNKLKTGDRLGPEQRAQLTEASKTLLGISQRSLYEKMITSRQELLDRGVDPTVVSDFQIQSLERAIGADDVQRIKLENNIIKGDEADEIRLIDEIAQSLSAPVSTFSDEENAQADSIFN